MIETKRVFGCAIAHNIFKSKYESLSQANRDRLDRVANRVRLTTKLRYQVSISENPIERYSYIEFALSNVELPSTEVYLLCTCLDTLAGNPVYKDYGEWFAENARATGLTREEVLSLYHEYQDEYGVRRNFRDLFFGLPKCTKSWLFDNVEIRPYAKQFEVIDRDVDTLIKRLFVYFYDVRRNSYTHGSVTRFTVQADKIEVPDSNMWSTPAQGVYFPDRKRPKKEMVFSYRVGLDEATILRMIIHSAALQLLEINITPDVILANIQNYARLDALYAYIREVNANAFYLKAWLNLSDFEKSDYFSLIMHSGISLLRDSVSSRLVDQYFENAFESGHRQSTLLYMNKIKSVNAAIISFNETNPTSEKSIDISQRRKAIREFFGRQAEEKYFEEILHWPKRPEIQNLWILIRDPCYS